MEDLGLLVLRLGLGGIFVYHGLGKLIGAPGLRATTKFFASLGLRPGRVYALLAAATELAAGVAVAAGFATALAGAAVVALMLVAAVTVTGRHGFAAERGGWEYNGVLGLVVVALAICGPGRWSLDHVLDVSVAGLIGAAVALGVGGGSALILLAVARRGSA